MPQVDAQVHEYLALRLGEDTQLAPGASEVIVELVNVDNAWYLRSVTNDHVVPGCRAVNS